MKYVLMFTSTPELDAAVPPERAQEVYGRIYEWFGEHAEHLDDSGAELHPVTTATTVKHGGDAPVVADGPFSEAKEVIGGFSVIDVPDLDAAIAIAKSWPALELPGVAVEVRPMIVDYSQFEE
ncbi:MAG: YciI family protein [Microbacterium sp.]